MRHIYFKRFVFTALCACVLYSSCGRGGDEGARSEFVKSELEWREGRGDAMRDSTSWLTIAGLFWLEEGTNSFGTSAENDFVLPEGSAPGRAGEFLLADGKVTVKADEGAALSLEGRPVKEKVLTSDSMGKPDVIFLGDLRMWVIERGGRLAIRLRDLGAKALREYQGLEFYPPTEDFRVEGEIVPFDSVRTVAVQTVVGTEAEMRSPGYARFRLSGRDLRLDLFAESVEADRFFIIFRDETSGKETYGACRFMSAKALGDGKVELNFNRAVNPPCAYTPYATCPLPPPGNIVPVRVEAGEKNYGKGGHPGH